MVCCGGRGISAGIFYFLFFNINNNLQVFQGYPVDIRVLSRYQDIQ